MAAMRWYQGPSIKGGVVALVTPLVVASLLISAVWLAFRWKQTHSPFHPIQIDSGITPPPPADPAARLNQLMAAYDGGSYSATFTEWFGFGDGKRLNSDKSELVWSRTNGTQRFDDIEIRNGELDGTTSIGVGGAAGVAPSSCFWKIVTTTSNSAETTCHPTSEDFSTTILYGVIRDLLDAPQLNRFPSTKVVFYGYTTQGTKHGECFEFDIGILNAGTVCLTADGAPLALEGDLQGGYYHVSLRATEVDVAMPIEQLTRQVVPLPGDSGDYSKTSIPLAQMTLPSTPLVRSFTGH